jgi:hypothetical protein
VERGGSLAKKAFRAKKIPSPRKRGQAIFGLDDLNHNPNNIH